MVVLWGKVDVAIGESTDSPLNNLMPMRRGGLVVVVCLGPADASSGATGRERVLAAPVRQIQDFSLLLTSKFFDVLLPSAL